MIRLENLKKVLKNNKFYSKIEGSEETYLFTFTEDHIFRDNQPLCDYALTERSDGFEFIFLRKYQNFSTLNFANIIFSVQGDSRFPIIVNWDSNKIKMGNGLKVSFVAETR